MKASKAGELFDINIAEERLRGLISQQEQIIFEKETEYLKETYNGNLFRGWEGLQQTQNSKSNTQTAQSRKNTKFSAQERLFSASSATAILDHDEQARQVFTRNKNQYSKMTSDISTSRTSLRKQQSQLKQKSKKRGSAQKGGEDEEGNVEMSNDSNGQSEYNGTVDEGSEMGDVFK